MILIFIKYIFQMLFFFLISFVRFGKNVKILHFIGQLKPWHVNFDSTTKQIFTPQGYEHLQEFLQLWWNIFCNQIHPQLSADMVSKKKIC